MDILMLVASVLLFVLLSVATIFLMFRVSSFFAMILLTLPFLLAALILPEMTQSFLSHEHFLLGEGQVPINNYHMLFVTWFTITGIVVYSEFLSWYMSRNRS
ncbi:phage shock protein PspC (stress-responsive transcriptional regulator) [Methanohalophilus levihalophilus]|uniref:hypothetical protein n=1 Tax=Methanohalophilus levihalophilus TaxID=1431282 RepID=UPI001AE940B6|nr:hypothetical protein [Methanohalophilus levihalophilus]MBP2030586.1 phage shock protein PspC (stress-responsive transcriptional regulator) [Methanohalophilus levihalophilus]